MSRIFAVFLGLILLTEASLAAEFRLAGIFGDHLVLQRDRPIVVWGWAEGGDRVTVDFAEHAVATTTNEDGRWQVSLPAFKANAVGRDMTAKCNGKEITVRDVVVGDVWLAGGQSNMAMTMNSVAQRLPQTQADLDAARLPAIRFRRISEPASAKLLDDLPARTAWTVCAPGSARHFSAAAFYFARKLHAELDVPIGVLDTSRGGTPIEPFIPRAAFDSHPTLQRELELGDREDLRGIWKLPGGVRARDANWLPGRLFHSGFEPLRPFALRGVIWYQGESNCGDGEDPRDYRHKMRALVTGWRKAFGDDELPFYFVQLPGSGAGPGWPALREEQRRSADLPRTGMVVTIDLLDHDIHPPNKFDVGERLARQALAGAYGRKIPFSGPLFVGADAAEGRMIVRFAHAESGLMTAKKDGLAPPRETTEIAPAEFELADKSGVWRPASAVVREQTVVVHSKEVSKPVAVRYGYAVNPQHCNLYNRDGLPAAPFCSEPRFVEYAPALPQD